MLMLISAIAGGVAATLASTALLRTGGSFLAICLAAVSAASLSWALRALEVASWPTPVSTVLVHLALGAAAGGAIGAIGAHIVRARR